MTNEHDTSGPDNSESELIRSLGELPDEVLRELEQLPPELLRSLAGISSIAHTALTRLPLETLSQLSSLSPPMLEWVGAVAATGVGSLDPIALSQLTRLAQESPGAVVKLRKIPPGAIQILAAVPPETLESLVKLPAELLTQLPAVFRATGETIEEVPTHLAATLDELPENLLSTLDQISPEAVSAISKMDSGTMASLCKLDDATVKALTAIPVELLTTLKEIPPEVLKTVLELPVETAGRLEEIDPSVFSDIAATGLDARPLVPQTLFVKLGSIDSWDGSLLGRLASEARSMRDIRDDALIAEASQLATLPELTPEQQTGAAAAANDNIADNLAASAREGFELGDEGDTADGEHVVTGGETIDDDEGNSQTMVVDDGGREYEDPGATVQSDEFASVDAEGDSDDSFGATVQSDEFAPVGDNSDESFDQTVQSDEGWSADGISAFDGGDNEDDNDDEDDASFDQTVQSNSFDGGLATASDGEEGDSYAQTVQPDEGWSEDGLSALDRSDDDASFDQTVQSNSFDGTLNDEGDSYGATVQSDSFDGSIDEGDSYGATVQSDSFDGDMTNGDDSYAQTMQSESMMGDPDSFGQTIASGVFGPQDGILGGNLTQAESNVKDAWKDQGPAQTQAEPRRGGKGPSGSAIPGSTLVITTRQLSTKNIDDYNKGRRPPEPHEPEYELVKVLGEGGMGIVFTAKQRSIDRDVALKMLKPKTARDKDQRAKFLSEAVVTGELDHPNIVPIYDVGATADQALFYSMKKVQGTPWLDVIKEKSVTENLDILMRSSDAVAFAHARGVIHRDLKPENTMLGDYGEVLVMDWGLAYTVKDEFSKSESITSSTSMGGTPAYMAPEMATGPISKIGPHSDVYLLGAILFEIVTTRPPHAGKNAMKCLMAAARNQIRDPDPEKTTVNDPTGELLEIAMKAMGTEPVDRYQTVQEFQTAIREYQSHRESVTLSSRAAADLKKARQSNDYQDYSKALFAYEEARSMWEGNGAAAEGVVEVKFAYAAAAEAKGDFDLGMSLLDQKIPKQQEMYARLKAAADEINARQARIEKMKKVGIGLVASIVVIIGVGFVLVEQQRQVAVANEKRAVANEEEAVKQTGIAEEQREIAVAAKDEAEALAIAEAKAKEDAIKQKGIAEKATAAAVIAKNDAIKQKGIAETAQKKEAEERKKAEALAIAEAKAKEDAIKQKGIAEKATAAAVIAKNDAIKQKGIAETAQKKEAEERKKAEALAIAEAKAKEDAIKQKGIAEKATAAAVIAKNDAIKQKAIAEAEEKKAKAAALAELKAKEAAQDAEKSAKAAEKVAVAAKEAEQNERKKAEAAAIAEAKARKEAVYQAYVASIGLADSQIRENAFDAALSVLNDPQRCPPELRNWEWGRLWHLCNQGKGTFNQNAPVNAIALSPDGSQFVTGGWDGRAVIWSISGKEIVSLDHNGEAVTAVDWSPNGEWIATGSNDRTNGYIQLWNAKTGKRVERSFGALDGTGESHVGPVLSVRFSPDGNSILSGSDDTTARLWDVATGKHVRLFFSHLGPIWDAEFDREGKRIVTASGDGTAIVWDVATGTGKPPFTGHDGPVYTAAFSPTGPNVATGSYDRRILLWNPGTLKEFDFSNLESKTAKVVSDPQYSALDGHSAPVRDIQFTSDGNQLVSGSDDNTVRLWSTETLKDEKTFRGHNGSVRSIVLAENDSIILTASKDNRIKKWNIDQYAEVKVLHSHVLDEHRAEVLSARFSKDGRRIVTASRDRSALTWNSETGERLAQFAEGHQFLTSSAVLFPNDKWIATAAADNSVRVWDLDSATQLFSLEPTGRAAALAVSADNKWLMTGSEDTKVGQESRYSAKVWNVETHELAFELTGQTANGYRGHLSEVTAVAFSPDGTLALTGDVRGRVILWNLKTRTIKHDLEGHSPRFKISAVAFLSDGSKALTASFDKTVAQWDVATGKEFSGSILRHGDAVTDLKVRKGDRHVVTTSRDGLVRVWDLDTTSQPVATVKVEGQPRAVSISDDGTRAVASAERPNSLSVIRLNGLDKAATNGTVELAAERTVSLESQRQLGAAVFTPGVGGKRVVVLGGAEARLLDLATGTVEKTFSPLGIVASANFSTNGKWIVTASWDRTARIWDAATGADIRKLSGPNGHRGDVRSAVFSPDAESRYVLTAGEDGRVIVWERETGQVRSVIDRHAGEATGASFSTDGGLILTSSADGTARVWDASGLWAKNNADTVKVVQEKILKGHRGSVLSATFSADSSSIVTTSEDGTAIVWDAASGDQLYTLAGHTAAVTAAAFSPTGDRVVTASNDGTVKIWDARRVTVDADDLAADEDEPAKDSDAGRKEILTLAGHSREVTSVAFSPGDGRYILTASVDGKAILWLTMAWDAPAKDGTGVAAATE
jgi:WD40 repeat protein/serine/threonine protein kinase